MAPACSCCSTAGRASCGPLSRPGPSYRIPPYRPSRRSSCNPFHRMRWSAGVLIASRTGGTIEDQPTRRILRAANGNPLAVELLTKEWLAHGSTSLLADLEALNTRPVANIGIPRAIGAVFERQIRRLDASARAALDLAAVLGRRLADLPLYATIGLSPAGAGETLSRLHERTSQGDPRRARVPE